VGAEPVNSDIDRDLEIQMMLLSQIAISSMLIITAAGKHLNHPEADESCQYGRYRNIKPDFKPLRYQKNKGN